MIRCYPFLENAIQLQNLNKESPNKLFTSLKEDLSILYGNIINREVCPEFFTNFDFYCNLNCSFLGYQHNNNIVDDFRVNERNDITGNLYSYYLKYNYIFRKILNSDLISSCLPNWIDFIFGIKQSEIKQDSFYKFHNISNEDKLNLEQKVDEYIKLYNNNNQITNNEIRKKISEKIDFLIYYGITPHKILKNTIKLKTSKKIKNSNKEYLEICENIFFVKNNDNILILFKNKKYNDNSKKILIWNYNNNIKMKELEKNLYNCGYIKQLDKIKNIFNKTKIPIYKPCYSMCTFIMFNKLFILTCRYLGNIFKVQNMDYCIDVLCEDFVTCITCRKVCNSNSEEVFIYSGLKNGKLIEWYVKDRLNDFEKINVVERNFIYCHKGEMTCMEIYENQKIIITGGEDKMIFIRKVYDFELLTAINLIYCYMNPIIQQKINIIPTLIIVSELNCIYVLLYNWDIGKSFIRGYNLNGLYFNQSDEQYYMNICFTKNSNLLVSYYDKNEIEILNCYDFRSVYTASLFPFVANCEKKNNKKEKEKGREDNGRLIWNDYYYDKQELILLFEKKIIKGSIVDKEDKMIINN